MIPTPVLADAETLRIYVTMCDASGVGRPGYVDVDARNPVSVRQVSAEPLLDVGRPGTFDENGVAVCSVVQASPGVFYMYYVGFELGTKIRYRLLTGLAVSRDGGRTFVKHQETPILERSPGELMFRCGPCVRADGGRFRMWYIAGSDWTLVHGKPMPVYGLRYMESEDGIHWPDSGSPGMELDHAAEHGFGRPWVCEDARGYELYYSIRRRDVGAYRLGYARSRDGRSWIRQDAEMGLDVTPGGFDGNAIMYSAVVTAGGRTFCFYNGDKFGEAGFAVAERVEER
jgi:hypothetical protein